MLEKEMELKIKKEKVTNWLIVLLLLGIVILSAGAAYIEKQHNECVERHNELVQELNDERSLVKKTNGGENYENIFRKEN